MVVYATITLTATGVAQNVAAGFATPAGISVPATDLASKDAACRTIALQADNANTAIVAIGGDKNVTTTVYGLLIQIPVTSIAGPPIILGEYDQGGIRLSDLWIVGTANDKVHVLAVVI